MDRFDTIIIGSGQAGPALAAGLVERGQTVALIEGAQLGGTCVNTGCTPTKTLRKSARVAHLARRAAEFGVNVGPVEVDFAKAMSRMRERSTAARTGLKDWLSSIKGLDLIEGWASFDGRDSDGTIRVAVSGRTLRARHVYLNTGTRPFLPPVEGSDQIKPLTNEELLALTERPGHLIVVGGSYIGLELGQIFRRLGSEVTIIHTADRLADREDEDVSGIIADVMRSEGIKLQLSTTVVSVAKTVGGVRATLKNGQAIDGTHILFATGRVPNTQRLNLASVGLEADARGYIQTDPGLKTPADNIWALGDINRRGAFTHTSYHDHEIVLAAYDGREDLHQWKDADQRVSTYAMFTDPPLGRVGLSKREAQALVAEGRRILISDVPMSRVSRAKEEDETAGLIRLLVDADRETIVGATTFGFAGDEVIAALTNFMATGASYKIMQQALPVHPTVAEFLPTILGGLKPLEATHD